MRKIFLEDLPKNNNNTVNWKSSVGCKVRFEYDNIQGVIDIVGYDNDRYYISLRYKDRERDMFVGSFKKCAIQELIGIRRSEYLYKVGDTVYDQYLIEKQTKIPHAKIRNSNAKSRSGMNKAYVVRCLKCKYVFTIGEDVFNDGKQKSYCKACGKHSKTAVKGYNDLWTTNPEIAQMLLNPDEGYKHLKASTKKVDWVCKNCKSIIKNKSFAHVYYHGLFCKNCNDGISYPEKIMREFLKQSGLKFEMHKVFDWSNSKEYDFYLPNYNVIVETHGIQHYNNSFGRLTDCTLKQVRDNDDYKMKLAIANNINKYIIIDCRESDFDFIYNNIRSSELSDIIDFTLINKDILIKNSLTNYLVKTCEMWNSGVKNVEDIAKEIGLSTYTITSYLKRCDKINLCDYKKFVKNKTTRRVKCKTTNELFDSMTDACKTYNIKSCAIRKSCLNNKYSAGKLSDKTKLYWEYVDEYQTSKG